ncbi:MAG: hypothetical protein J1E60_02540 [Christensenellaceae bacterium]|nr:hypothetical protein [Christensenellaceae bacterium]
MRTKDCSNKSGAANRTISVALFSVIWFTVCVATVIAAIEMPLSKLIKGGNAGNYNVGGYNTNGNQSDMHGAYGQNTNESTHNFDGNSPLMRTYRSFTLRQAADNRPMLIEGDYVRSKNDRVSQREMLAPIESLCMFMSSGDTDDLFSAVHPKLTEYLMDKFGAAIDLLGGSKVLLQHLAKSILNEDVSFIGEADSVDYEVLTTRELNEAQMNEIDENAESWHSDLNISEAARIELRFRIKLDSDVKIIDSKLTVFKTTEGWFIDIGKALMGS